MSEIVTKKNLISWGIHPKRAEKVMRQIQHVSTTRQIPRECAWERDKEFYLCHYGVHNSRIHKAREILKAYPPGFQLNRADQEFMSSILKRHPSRDEKIGCGLEHIVVDWNKCYPDTICFHVVRSDGTKAEFSYRKCLGLPMKGCGCDG